MTDEKWQDLVLKIEDKFKIEEHSKKEDVENHEKIEWIIFEGPEGKTKIERIIKPKLLEKRTHYSRRIGAPIEVEYIYSQTEFISTLKAYRWNKGEERWEEISPSFS